MTLHKKHDYLLFTAILILLIAALGAAALHHSGTAAAGNAVYNPCQELYAHYMNNNCNIYPSQNVCIKIMHEKERRFC